MKKRLVLAVATPGARCVLALWVMCGPATAQVATATLSGVVVDASGAGLDLSAVELVFDDGRVLEFRTDSSGAFTATVSGSFEIRISHPGYRTVRTTPVRLTTGGAYQVEIQLFPGDPADGETVELVLEGAVALPEASGPALRTDLPRYDRLFGLRGGINVSGIAEGSSQQWIAASGNVFASSPSAATLADSFEFSAAFEPNVGVDDSLPPGGRRFNGDLYYFHRNDALNARNYFDRPDEPIPPFKYHFFGAQAGGALGGETYGFVRYWGLRVRQSVTRAATVPDPAMVGGDFSSSPEPIRDPETGFPFPENIIPPDRLHPEGVALARRYPSPNVEGSAIRNFLSVGLIETVADAFGVRVDHRATASDESSFEYQYSRDTTQDPFNLVTGITNLPSFGVRDALTTSTFRAANAHVFSSSVLHQVDFTFGYLGQPRQILDSSPTPAVIVAGLSGLGHATSLPQDRRNRTMEVSTEVGWAHGAQTTTFGGGTRYFAFDAFMDLLGRGQFQFNGGSYSGNALANLLLGLPATAMRIEGETSRKFTTWTSAAYLQHEWRVRPDLLLSGGLRYTYQTPFGEATGRVANFHPDGSMETSPSRLYAPDRNNWGPRVGLAWNPLPDTVVRGGFGIFFDSLAVGDSLFMLGLNPPFVRFDVENNDPVLPRFDLTGVFDEAGDTVPPSVFSTSPRLANPYIQQWNLRVGRTFRPGLDISVSYTGQKGTHLRRQVNLNQPPAGDAATLDDRRPFLEFRNIFQFETSASSSNHALDIGVVGRVGSGLSFQSGYRLARAIDDATLISILPQNSHDLKGERGLSDFNVKHRFTLSGAYDIPWDLSFAGDGEHGWELLASMVAQSGTPLSAILGIDVAGTGNPIVNRPNLVGDPKVDDPTPARFFNTQAFQPPEPGHFGDSGRNVIPGPGLANLDLALLRDFHLSNVVSAQFRVDAYNVLNHPNFIAPPTMQNFADSPDFGALFVARSPRILQAGLQVYW